MRTEELKLIARLFVFCLTAAIDGKCYCFQISQHQNTECKANTPPRTYYKTTMSFKYSTFLKCHCRLPKHPESCKNKHKNRVSNQARKQEKTFQFSNVKIKITHWHFLHSCALSRGDRKSVFEVSDQS